MSDDVELGLKFTKETATGIEEISARIKRLDQEIISVQKNLDRTGRSLDQFASKKDKASKAGGDDVDATSTYKALQTLLSRLRTEQASARRYLDTEASRIAGPNATASQKAQLNAAIAGIMGGLVSSLQSAQDAIAADANKRQKQQEREFERLEAKRKRQQKQQEQEFYTRVRSNENKRLSGLLDPRNRNFENIKDGELKALIKQNKELVRQSQKQGLYGTSEQYQKLGDDLGKALEKRLNPDGYSRTNRLNSLRDNTKLDEFIKWARPTELKQFRDDARRSTKSYSQKMDVENAEAMARISNKLDGALKKLDPKVNRLYTTADMLRSDPSSIKKLQKRSVEDLSELQSAMLSEAKKRFRQNDTATGQILADTSNQLKGVISNKKMPYLADNNRQLLNLINGTASLGEFNTAGLKSLKADALKESGRLSKLDRNDDLAEQLRVLSKKIQAQIDQRERIDKPDKVVKQKSVNSELSQYDNDLVRKISKNRFDDSLFKAGGSFSGLANAPAYQQQEVKRMTELMKKAQQLRYNSALQNNESKESIKLEREALNLAEQRLQKVKATVTETKRLRDAQERRKTIDPEELAYSARKDIAKSQVRRSIDGGAEQFRNQGILLRNYALMGAGVGGAYAVGQFTVDLDKSLRQLQSILALTNTEMVDLENNLISVSEKTKFTAVEVTEAGIILGQSGLSKDQIVDTVEGITLFATAIGTDLKTAVDLATSTLGVFNIDSSRMTEVVDKLTTSVNNSKLNLDKLTLGIQYAGNIAAQSNVTFEETVATLGAMANSGIRSGSTLGTGLRQILITLQNPSDKFRKKIASLGLTMEDLDLRTHGLVNVMTTLANKGFTVTDAMQVMEVRAASAFGAFANNLEVAGDLAQKMEEGGSATKANAVQMEAFSNQLARFGSIAKSLFYDALKPVLTFLTEALEKTGDFLQTLRGTGNVLSFILATITSIGAVRVGSGVLKLLSQLSSGGVAGLLGGAAGVGGRAAGAGLLARVGTLAFGGPIAAGVGLLATAGAYAYTASQNSQKHNDPLDIATAAVNRNEASLERYNGWLKTLSTSLDSLYLKQVEFQNGEAGADQLRSFIRKLNNELKDMGFYLDENASSFDDVSSKLITLKKEITTFRAQGLTNGGELASVQLQAQAYALMPELEYQNNRATYLSNTRNVLSRNPRAMLNSSSDSTTMILAGMLNNQLGQFDPAAITQGLTQLRAEDGVAAKAQGLQSQAQQFYNLLSGVGNLPDGEIAKVIEENRGAFRFGNTSEEVKGFRTRIQSILEQFKIVLDTSQELTSLATTFEQTNAGTPQKLLGITDELNRTFKPELLNLMSQLGVDKKSIIKNTSGDPIARYDQATALRDTTLKTLETQIENAAQVRAVELLTEAFGENYPKNYLNKVLTQSEILPSSISLRSELSGFQSQQRSDADKAYYQRSEARLRTLESQKDLVSEEMKQAKNLAELNDLKARQIKIEDEIAKINTKRSLFKIDGTDAESKKQIEEQGTFAKIARDAAIAEATERRATIIETKELLAQKRQLRLNAKYQREQARAIREFYATELKTQEIIITNAKTVLEQNKNFAGTLNDKAEYKIRRGNDGQLTADSRIGFFNQATALSSKALDVENTSISKLIVQYQATNKELKSAIADLQLQLKSTGATGDVARAINGTIEKYKDAIADNSLKVEKLTGEQADNTEKVDKQTETLLGNTRALEREGYVNRTPQKQQLGARLRGGSYTTDLGDTESFSDNKSDGQRYFDVVATEVNKTYADFDALTASAEGLIDIANSIGQAGASAFSSWITGASSAGDAFKAFGVNLLDQLANIASQILANQVMSQILGAFVGNAAGSYGGGANGGGTISSSSGAQISAYSGAYVTRGYNSGGEVTSGIETRDSTYAKVAKGEFILRNEAVKAIGIDTVRQLNSLDRSSAKQVKTSIGSVEPSAQESSAKGGDINFWMVPSKDDIPALGPNDVITVFEDDVSRNGRTKKLIKRIARGEI